jgi:hypothetical protein
MSMWPKPRMVSWQAMMHIVEVMVLVCFVREVLGGTRCVSERTVNVWTGLIDLWNEI